MPRPERDVVAELEQLGAADFTPRHVRWLARNLGEADVLSAVLSAPRFVISELADRIVLYYPPWNRDLVSFRLLASTPRRVVLVEEVAPLSLVSRLLFRRPYARAAEIAWQDVAAVQCDRSHASGAIVSVSAAPPGRIIELL